MKPREKNSPPFRFSILIFFVSLLFTFVVWDHYFDSDTPLDRTVVSNLVLMMGTLFSIASALFVWSLESRRLTLEEEVKKRSGELLEKERDEIALFQSCKAIFATVKLDTLLEVVMDLVQRVLKADEGSLMLLDKEGKLYIAASRGIDKDIVSKVHLGIGERVAGKVAQDKRDLLLNGSLAKYPKFQGVEDNARIRSSIVCPLLYKNELLGVLNLNRTVRQENFTPHDLRNASTLASQVAEAIQKVKLYEALENKIVELKETNQRLKEMQQQLVESEKLASIGRLVAGVAHELNNPMTAVLGYTDLLLNDFVKGKEREKSQIQKHLSVVSREAHRCRQIVQDLLTFARRREPSLEDVDPCFLIDEVLDVLSFEFKKGGVWVEKKYPTPRPSIQADPSQLRQVFLNLIVNARDALQEKPEEDRRIDISVTAERQKLRFLFKDNGPGIAEENLDKIFEPFFTTKEVGKGTGLGLSLSYGIIESHGGKISVTSEEGKGAAFTIELPVAVSPQKTTPPPKETAHVLPDGKSREVLLVEDQASILGFIEDILTPSGCAVESVFDGETALSKIQEKDFDLVICDYHLPRMDGRHLFEKVQAFNSDLASRFFFITGCSIDENMSNFFKKNNLPCLRKPFTADNLLAAIGSKLND